jgi:hypothetical protein
MQSFAPLHASLDTLRQDSCHRETHEEDQEQQYKYTMWTPAVAGQVPMSELSAPALRSVNEESLLQGRGRAYANPNCQGPRSPDESSSGGALERPPPPHLKERTLHDTASSGFTSSISETDIFQRMSATPYSSGGDRYRQRFPPAPTPPTGGRQEKYAEGVTLSTKKYVDFHDAAKADRYA